jgi:hypothetical protein
VSVTVKETQGRGRPTLFSQEIVKQVIQFERQEMSYSDMSKILNIHPNTIRVFVSRNRDKLGIERRGYRGFDREWHGVIPRGHWAVCKPWGSERFYGVLRRSLRLGVGVGYYEG